MCLGVKRHLASGHEISRLQHGLQLIMARYTRTINCRPCCNLYLVSQLRSVDRRPLTSADELQHCDSLPRVGPQLGVGPLDRKTQVRRPTRGATTTPTPPYRHEKN